MLNPGRGLAAQMFSPQTPGVWWSCSTRPVASHPQCWLSKRGRGGGPDVPQHKIKTVLMVRNLLVCGSAVRVTRCHVTGVTWRLSPACVTASRLRGVSGRDKLSSSPATIISPRCCSPHPQQPSLPLLMELHAIQNLQTFSSIGYHTC